MTALREMFMANPLGAFNQGQQIGQEQRTRRTLSEHMQGAIGGDQNALSQIYGADPDAGFKVDQLAQGRQGDVKAQVQTDLQQTARLWRSAPPELKAQLYQKMTALSEQAGIIEPGSAPKVLDTPELEQTFGKFADAIAGQSAEQPRIVAPGSALVGNDGQLIYERPFAPAKPQNASFQVDDEGNGWWLAPGQAPIPATGGAPQQQASQASMPNDGPGSLNLSGDPSQWHASIGELVKPFGGSIGSTTGGKHNVGSLHPGGNAVDIPLGDWRNISPENQQAMIDRLSSQPGIRVRDERQRPAGQKEWSGPHLHVERVAQAGGGSAGPRFGKKTDSVRRMSADEVRAAGFRPGSIVEVGADGSSRVVQAPADTKDASTGKPRPLGAVTSLTKDAGKLVNLQDLTGRFQDGFAGNTITGGAENLMGRLGIPGATEGQADWWQQYDRYKNEVRNELFGASLTAGEQAAFKAADVEADMAPARIKANLAKQAEIIQKGLDRKARVWAAQGYNREAIEEATGVQLGGPKPIPSSGTDIDALLDKWK